MRLPTWGCDFEVSDMMSEARGVWNGQPLEEIKMGRCLMTIVATCCNVTKRHRKPIAIPGSDKGF